MRDEIRSPGTLIIQTIVATVLAIVTYIIVATIAGMLFYIADRVILEVRPVILQFMAMIIGSVLGIAAARWCCDQVLRDYSRRAVFVAFVLCGAAVTYIEFEYVPVNWNQINSAAQLISGLITAFVVFWQDQPISDSPKGDAPGSA